MNACFSGFRPDAGNVFDVVATRLRVNATTVLDEARRRGTSPHGAGRSLAEEWVRAAMESGGFGGARACLEERLRGRELAPDSSASPHGRQGPLPARRTHFKPDVPVSVIWDRNWL